MAVRPLRPATDRRFGGPLPRQLANRTRTHPIPIKSFHTVPCDTVRLCGIISRFQLLSPCMGQVVHALLTRPPLRFGKICSIASYFTRQRQVSVRLACVRHAASVHPEPGSNSRNEFLQILRSASFFFLSLPLSQMMSILRSLPRSAVASFI